MFSPMPLLRAPQPFDDPDWVFELKWDGFRALAVVDGGSCRFVSRNGYTFGAWPALAATIARDVASDAVLDGEIVCLDADGRANFYDLLFRRKAPHFYAFDVLSMNGRDLRRLPLLARKRRLHGLLRRASDRLRYVDHVVGRGAALYQLACTHDLEGVVGKWTRGSYQPGPATSWLKIKNPAYSQMANRHRFFEGRRNGRHARRTLALI